jgi:hypothetical protein
MTAKVDYSRPSYSMIMTTRADRVVSTAAKLNAALAALPEFSRKVYEAIHAGLYAEPGFSDVNASDVARWLKCEGLAVNAALKHLVEAGLVYTEGEGRDRWLHTYEHSSAIER